MNLSCVLSGPVYLLPLTLIVPIEVGELLSLWQLPSSIGAFLLNFPVSSFLSLEFFILFYFSTRFLPLYVSLHSILQSIIDNDFDKSAKHRGLKVDTDVVLYENLECLAKDVCSATISVTGLTDPDEFHCRLHGIDLNRGNGSDLLVKK